MIEPTVGRIVHFTPAITDSLPGNHSGQPLAAFITHVHGERCVNLAVFDANGGCHSRTSVTLLQDDDEPNQHGYYAQWMPFQKGQAAKTEAVQNRLDALQIAGNAV